MRYLLLRRSSRAHEAGQPPPATALAALADYTAAMERAGILRASEDLLPSACGVRLRLAGGSAGLAEVAPGPFTEPGDMLAGFVIIDVACRQEALDWLRRWPVEDEGAVIELREAGCPGGCADVQPAPGMLAEGKRFAVLLRSSADLEGETPVAQEKLDALDLANAREAKKGVLLAADGLRTSALGKRIKLAGGKAAIIDGPFTEIKELIAGYWLIRAASLDAAIAWAKRNPYPCGPAVEVEIREVAEQEFTPQLQLAEQRMRASQLEAGMLGPQLGTQLSTTATQR